MKNKLDTIYTLTIRPEYASLIPIVATENGWDGEGDPKDFLANYTNEFSKINMQNLIESALRRHYGSSQAPLIDQAMIDYKGSVEVTSTWSEVE